MEKLDITDELIDKIAAADFHKYRGRELSDQTNWVLADWREGARQMVTDYNRVVEILNPNETPNRIGKLYKCAYLRNVYALQHRTIAEFAWFVHEVIWSKNPECKKYLFEFNGPDAMEIWIDKFHEYCVEKYSEMESDDIQGIQIDKWGTDARTLAH